MATVNEDGSPHNSPLVFLYDERLETIYWGSHPESQHSKNVMRTGQAYFVAFDSVSGGPGLYFRTTDAHMAADAELEIALKVHNHFRTNLGKKEIDIEYYQGSSHQRMWSAKIDAIWTNSFERGTHGMLTRDFKIEVDLTK